MGKSCCSSLLSTIPLFSLALLTSLFSTSLPFTPTPSYPPLLPPPFPLPVPCLQALQSKLSKTHEFERTNFTGSGARLGHTVRVGEGGGQAGRRAGRHDREYGIDARVQCALRRGSAVQSGRRSPHVCGPACLSPPPCDAFRLIAPLPTPCLLPAGSSEF